MDFWLKQTQLFSTVRWVGLRLKCYWQGYCNQAQSAVQCLSTIRDWGLKLTINTLNRIHNYGEYGLFHLKIIQTKTINYSASLGLDLLMCKTNKQIQLQCQVVLQFGLIFPGIFFPCLPLLAGRHFWYGRYTWRCTPLKWLRGYFKGSNMSTSWHKMLSLATALFFNANIFWLREEYMAREEGVPWCGRSRNTG